MIFAYDVVSDEWDAG